MSAAASGGAERSINKCDRFSAIVAIGARDRPLVRDRGFAAVEELASCDVAVRGGHNFRHKFYKGTWLRGWGRTRLNLRRYRRNERRIG